VGAKSNRTHQQSNTQGEDMTKVKEMWEALTAYQQQADAAGHGKSWARMCKEKTAYYAAYYAADAARSAEAADYAADAADAAADADAEKWVQRAIERINKVLVKPEQPAQQEPKGKQFQAKFNIEDRVWYMKNNKPTEVVISAIEVFYANTNQDCITYNAKNVVNSVSWLDHRNLQEAWLFKSKIELLESL
jgi:hypothetical protein